MNVSVLDKVGNVAMAGNQTGIKDAREQVFLQRNATGETETAHMFPQCELPLPGTMPSTSSVEKPEGTDSVGNSNYITRDEASVSSKGAVAVGSTLIRANGVVPDSTTAPELLSGPRPTAPSASAGGNGTVASMEIQEALLPPQQAVPFEHPISLPRRRWMVFMFCLVAALLFADQNLLAPNLTAAANYFDLSDRAKDTLLGGALMAAFFAVGAPAALLVGWLADRGDINRRTLLFWVVVVGETPCLLTYWVKSYWQFFLLRALTGVAVGGCFPLVFSLLGDLYPPGKRAGVSAVVQIATGVGLAVGQALSGSIGPATNWRVPFVVVAAPSLAVALLMQLTTVEPPRGAFEEALRERYSEGLGAYEGSISWAKVAVLLRCPSNVLVIGQGLPGSLPWGMVLTFFNDFLAQQKGFTVQAATVVLLFFAGGGAVGVIGGGAGGQWLYNKRKEYQALLAGGCVLAGIGPLYALINADLQRIGLGATCVVAALGGAVASVAGPNLRSVMLNVNEPETRGVALALQSMTDDLGKGLGPVLVAGLIRALGREGAFNVAAAGWIPCGILLASLSCFLRRDEAAMQARLAHSSEAQAAATSAAAQAASGTAEGDAVGTGITVELPPATPPSRSDGGVAGDGDGAIAAAAVAAATAAALRKEERRLAKVRLLAAADGGVLHSSSDVIAVGSNGATYGATTALPLSSSASSYLERGPAEGASRWTQWGSGARADYGAGGLGLGPFGAMGSRAPATAAAAASAAAATTAALAPQVAPSVATDANFCSTGKPPTVIATITTLGLPPLLPSVQQRAVQAHGNSYLHKNSHNSPAVAAPRAQFPENDEMGRSGGALATSATAVTINSTELDYSQRWGEGGDVSSSGRGEPSGGALVVNDTELPGLRPWGTERAEGHPAPAPVPAPVPQSLMGIQIKGRSTVGTAASTIEGGPPGERNSCTVPDDGVAGGVIMGGGSTGRALLHQQGAPGDAQLVSAPPLLATAVAAAAAAVTSSSSSSLREGGTPGLLQQPREVVQQQ